MAEVSIGSAPTGSEYPEGPAQKRYARLQTDRDPFLKRAREAARLTIPSLFPEEGATGTTDYPTPYQGIGARGTNNLTAKMQLALFPPGGEFFRVDIDQQLKEEIAKATEGLTEVDAIGEIDKALRKTEDAVVQAYEAQGGRPVTYQALRKTIVGGNSLLKVEDDGSLCEYRLDQYVVKRDRRGKPLEIIVQEHIEVDSMDQELLDFYKTTFPSASQSETPPLTYVYVYTHVKRGAKAWTSYQEMRGMEIPKTRGTYPLDKSCWIPLCYNRSAGEDYGRGLVEEYAGDLSGMESLSQALIEGSLAAARVLFFTDEAGTTQAKDVAEAENLAVLEGRATDVTTLKLEKYADFTVAKNLLDTVEIRLAKSFLENTSVQRQAERVTAEEVRFLAGELEDALGGVYSLLSRELQFPLVTRLLYQLGKKRKLPRLPEKAVNIRITTGIEALGRGANLRKLDALVAGTKEFLGESAIQEYVKGGAYIKRRATELSVDVEGLIRSEEEVAQARQAAQMQELAGKAAGPAINAVSDQMSQGSPTT